MLGDPLGSPALHASPLWPISRPRIRSTFTTDGYAHHATLFSFLGGSLDLRAFAFGGFFALVLLVSTLTALIRQGKSGPRRVKDEILDGIREISELSFRRIWALAVLTYRESVRRKTLLIFVVFAVLFMFAGWFMRDADPGRAPGVRVPHEPAREHEQDRKHYEDQERLAAHRFPVRQDGQRPDPPEGQLRYLADTVQNLVLDPTWPRFSLPNQSRQRAYQQDKGEKPAEGKSAQI